MSADRKRRRSLRRDEGGTSALEFALVAPVFLAMLFGLFQLGWAFHCGSSVRYALEEASRSLMLDPGMTQAEIETQMRARLNQLADPDISVSMTTENPAAGLTLAHVNATYEHPIVVPFLPEYDFTFTSEVTVPISG